jgi:hypothetical protein
MKVSQYLGRDLIGLRLAVQFVSATVPIRILLYAIEGNDSSHTDDPAIEGNDIPECFRVPIPAWSASADKVSPECVSFLGGLLDVRIPLRLGSPNSFDSFSSHLWLCTHNIPGFDGKAITTHPPPPFIPNLQEVEDILIQNLNNATTPESDIPLQRISPLDLDRLQVCFNSISPSSRKDMSMQPTLMSTMTGPIPIPVS